ncbi:hypothetical protein GCM10010302_05800 [Streptomyces polychromogenes]|uniref:Uncharacterized protein n=1 Tax=Streptomyces polychromogenes TaxID=67342 RepID=A0ABN0V217_9ACTN
MYDETAPQADEAPEQQQGGETFEPNNAFELLDIVPSSDSVAHQPDSVLG